MSGSGTQLGVHTAFCAMGSPLFRHMQLSLEKGKTCTIDAPANSDKNIYVQSVTLNGQPLNRTWVSRNEILAGGTLHFDMGVLPNKSWGTGPSAAPYSTAARRLN